MPILEFVLIVGIIGLLIYWIVKPRPVNEEEFDSLIKAIQEASYDSTPTKLTQGSEFLIRDVPTVLTKDPLLAGIKPLTETKVNQHTLTPTFNCPPLLPNGKRKVPTKISEANWRPILSTSPASPSVSPTSVSKTRPKSKPQAKKRVKKARQPRAL